MAPGKFYAARILALPRSKLVSLDQFRANIPPPTLLRSNGPSPTSPPEEHFSLIERFRKKIK
jgi:hypothetical protein